MKGRPLRHLLIVSFTGFLFAFDSVVISGVNLPLKQLWQMSEWYHGTFIISISLWGTLFGAMVGGHPAEILGRKRTLIITGFVFALSGLGTALATTPEIFSFFRFLGGMAAGIGSIAAPTYIAEMADARNRGKLAMLFQFSIVSGILTAFLSNYFFARMGDENSWRLMLGVIVIPAGIYTLALCTVQESSRWLAVKHAPTLPEHGSQSSRRLFSGRYNRVLILSFLITFFNQFSGISVILFYAPEIMVKAGWGTMQSLLCSVSIGIVNLGFTAVGMYLIDKIGRRQLMYIGSVGYIISLSMIALGFYAGLSATFTLVFILLFIISHAVGQGAVIWVFLAEIFPNQVRSFGQSWSAGWLNTFAALTTLLGAVVFGTFAPWVIFAVFAIVSVGQLLFTHLMMPETKTISLEELEQALVPKQQASGND